ncbi:hypothetical protein POTOM_027679 [Populus tomentosa]|uniref:Uncharacterized protein n=1 Tax=Populus tomentosa TaxID=118781 RepID=A0A8X7ZHA0_POPTO|nr:hypothetical protein POTOM_027679 [Populus tomentosa]
MKESKNPTKPLQLKTSKNLKNQDFLQTGIVVEMMMKMNLESILKNHMEITLKNQTLRMMVLFCQREKVLTLSTS